MRDLTPEQQARIDQFAAALVHPLSQLTCPACNIRFGIDPTELRFAEQTGARIWCPRGHRLKATHRQESS